MARTLCDLRPRTIATPTPPTLLQFPNTVMRHMFRADLYHQQLPLPSLATGHSSTIAQLVEHHPSTREHRCSCYALELDHKYDSFIRDGRRPCVSSFYKPHESPTDGEPYDIAQCLSTKCAVLAVALGVDARSLKEEHRTSQTAH